VNDFITQPISDTEAEQSVIGSVLISQEAFYDAAEYIKPDDFYIVRHRWIWEAFIMLRGRSEPIDILTVTKELEKSDQLAEIGGSSYLMGCVSNTPSSMHAGTYAKYIKDAATRRRLIAAADQIARIAYNQSDSIEKTVSDSITSVLEIAGDAVAGQTKSAHDVFSDLYDHVEDLAAKPDNYFPGVPTGLADLDTLMGGGLQPSRLYICGGRPGQGKTSLLLTILHHVAYKKRHKVAVFSLEMDNLELAQRLAAIDAELNGQTIQTGKLTEEDWGKFTVSIDSLANIPVMFDDTAYLTPSQMRAKCKRIQAQFGLDLVILDYLGLLTPDREYGKRVDEVSEISRAMKQLAKELKVPILAAHQLSRAVEQRTEKRPQLSDLRDSGSIEQDADCVWFIYQDESREKVAHLETAKHRNGPTGMVNLVFLKEQTRFVPLERGNR
jgi:replicative DNA helicase